MTYTRLCYLIIFITFPILAQQREAPKKEFNLQAAPNAIAVSRGNSGTIVLTISRSKRYQRSEAQLGVGSALPEGVSLAYDKALGMDTAAHVTITASERAEKGDFNLILNCTLNYKTKGVVIRISIP